MSNELFRIVAAVKIIEKVRENIAANDGRYSGMDVPNLQSAIEVLTISDEFLRIQMNHESPLPDVLKVTREEKDMLLSGWRGE